MIDLPCKENKSPAPGIYQIQSAFLNSLLHRTLTCPAAGFYTEETLQLRGAGHKHHWDFFSVSLSTITGNFRNETTGSWGACLKS